MAGHWEDLFIVCLQPLARQFMVIQAPGVGPAVLTPPSRRHADAALPPAAPPRAAQGLVRLALICDPAHHSSGPTLLLEIHDPSDRVPPYRHVHEVEMLFVLRSRVPEGGLHDFESKTGKIQLPRRKNLANRPQFRFKITHFEPRCLRRSPVQRALALGAAGGVYATHGASKQRMVQ
jgi:hypothetical protein